MKDLLKFALDNTRPLLGNTPMTTVAYSCLIAVGFVILITLMCVLIGIMKMVWRMKR